MLHSHQWRLQVVFFRQEIDFLIAAIKTHKTRVKNVQRKFVKFLWWLKRFHELVVFILHLSKLISLVESPKYDLDKGRLYLRSLNFKDTQMSIEHRLCFYGYISVIPGHYDITSSACSTEPNSVCFSGFLRFPNFGWDFQPMQYLCSNFTLRNNLTLTIIFSQ